MRSRNFFSYAGVAILLAALVAVGAASSSSAPGYITVGLSPVAQFDAHYAFTTLPTTVSFIDTSLGSTPMTFAWDFGDGATSTDQNPNHIYTKRGTYTVSLTVKNAFGTSTAIKKDFITVGVAARPDFVGTPTSGEAPLIVSFTEKTTGPVSSWHWDFGDGQGSNEKNPTHTYTVSGEYNVILTVSNEYGQSDVTKTKYITVTGDLVSRFAATPLAGKAPLAVRFEDRSIGGPTKWAWDFNDGAISNVQNPVHTFAEPGSYTVKLTINRNDVSASFTQIVNVGGVPNTDFSASPLAVNVNEPITFTDKTTNNPTSWKWDFGDAAETTLQNPTHAYQVKGIYTVSLATRNDNGRDTEIKKNYINVGMGPKADFRPVIAMYQQYYVPLRVVFIDQSLSNPTSWTWDFGDGITSTEQNPAHLYAKAGTYTVALTVKNSFGQDTMTKKDCIVVGGGAAVDFSASPTVVGVGRYVTFTDLSANNPTAWVWDFGDGTTGSGANPDHAYVSVGTYDVTLTASNIGQSNSMTRNKYITVINIPRADFTTDKIRGGAPMTVQFTDKSSGAPVSWKWDFGDGGSSIEQNPKHTYSTLGTYTVSLTVSNKDGSDTTTKVNLIATTLAPVADFKADRQVGKAPFIVTFTDISTNNPTAWSWDFGDGTSSSEQNPRHIYLREGAYDVSLTATNQYGSDKAFKTGTAATAAGTVTQTPAVAPITTVSVQVAGEGAKATSTKAPLSPIVTLIGAITGMAAIVFVSRK